MQVEEAKEAISRLIRQAMPEGPSQRISCEAPATSSGINFFGGANIVQIHINSQAMQQPAQQPVQKQAETYDAPQSDHPALVRRRKEIMLSRLAVRSTDLGKPDLYKRFLKSVYGTCDISMLDEASLARAMKWLNETD